MGQEQEGRQPDRLPVLAGGKQNCWAKTKTKRVVDGGNQCRFLQHCSAPSQPHAHLLPQADGQPALLPCEQRPPTRAGLSFLPSPALTPPCNIPQDSDAALTQEAAPLHLHALRALSTALLRLILFMLRYCESHKHT